MVNFIDTTIMRENIIPEDGILVIQESMSLYININTAISLFGEADAGSSLITKVINWFKDFIKKMIIYVRNIFGVGDYNKPITKRGWENTYKANDVRREMVSVVNWCNSILASTSNPEVTNALKSNIEKLKKEIAIFGGESPFSNTSQLKAAVKTTANIVDSIISTMKKNNIKIFSLSEISTIAKSYANAKLYTPLAKINDGTLITTDVEYIINEVAKSLAARKQGAVDNGQKIIDDIVESLADITYATYTVQGSKLIESGDVKYKVIPVHILDDDELAFEIFESLSKFKVGNTKNIKHNFADAVYMGSRKIVEVSKVRESLDKLKLALDNLTKDIEVLTYEDSRVLGVYSNVIATLYSKFVDYDSNYVTMFYLQMFKYNLAKLCAIDDLVVDGGENSSTPSEPSEDIEDATVV